jgi:hypothetical protein
MSRSSESIELRDWSFKARVCHFLSSLEAVFHMDNLERRNLETWRARCSRNSKLAEVRGLCVLLLGRSNWGGYNWQPRGRWPKNRGSSFEAGQCQVRYIGDNGKVKQTSARGEISLKDLTCLMPSHFLKSSLKNGVWQRYSQFLYHSFDNKKSINNKKAHTSLSTHKEPPGNSQWKTPLLYKNIKIERTY